jgi:hypothetical protein
MGFQGHRIIVGYAKLCCVWVSEENQEISAGAKTLRGVASIVAAVSNEKAKKPKGQKAQKKRPSASYKSHST